MDSTQVKDSVAENHCSLRGGVALFLPGPKFPVSRTEDYYGTVLFDLAGRTF